MNPENKRLRELTGLLFQAHPWHDVSPGANAPEEVVSYIEIVPTDAVKYELDKESGHLRIDRPQRYSSMCPTLYGFIPQTFCAEAVAERCMSQLNVASIKGDGDPLDICVLTEKAFTHGNFLLKARPIGGLRMIDAHDADDKIVAVLVGDVVYDNLHDISEVPHGLIDRLRHYFLSYKQIPGDEPRRVEIPQVYGRSEALEVIRRSQKDYTGHFGDPDQRLNEFRALLRGKD